MSVCATDVLDTIDHLYAAVQDTERWSDALRSLASLLSARAAGLRIETIGVGVRQRWVGLEPEFEAAYVQHYWRHDPWVKPAYEADVGMVGYGDAIAPRRIVEASAYHNELALPNGFDDMAGALLERSSSRVVSLGVMKGQGARRFSDEDGRVLARVVPHVRRAVVLSERLAGALSVDDDLFAPLIEDLLIRRYGLTKAEARVAWRIGRGLAPKDVAVEHDVSWHTIRAQLRQIYAKTETRSQRALARLITLSEANFAADMALVSDGKRKM